MNFTPESQTEKQNPWRDRENFPRPDRRFLVLSYAALLLCGIGIPFATLEPVALIVLAALFAYTAFAVRSPYPVTVILVTAVIGAVLGGSLSLGATVLSAVVGSGVLAYLLSVSENKIFPFLPLLGALAIAFAVTGEGRIAVGALGVLPAGVLLSLATVNGRPRTGAILLCEIGLLLSLGGALFLLLWQFSGSRGIALADSVTEARTAVEQLFFDTRDLFLSFGDRFEVDPAELDALRGTLGDDVIRDTVATMFNLLPGICCILCAIGAYEAQMLLFSLCHASGLGKLFPPIAQNFTMSVPAAVLYVVSFLFSLFTSPNDNLFFAMMGNLSLILLPGFVLFGIRVLLASVFRSRGGAKLLIPLLAAALCCCYPTGVLLVLALWGADNVILFAIRSRLMSSVRHGGDGDGDGNGNGGNDGGDGE